MGTRPSGTAKESLQTRAGPVTTTATGVSRYMARLHIRHTILTAVLGLAAGTTTLATPSPAAASAGGFVHPKIDSHAQKALAAIASEGPDGAKEAAMILGAVRSGALGGVYLANQGVPALRAQKFGTSWWTLHPPGIDGVVLPPHPSQPGSRPILVLRKSVASKAAARKGAVRHAFAAFALLQSQTVSPCSGGTKQVSFVAGSPHCATSNFVPPFVKLPHVIELVLDRAQPWGADYVGSQPLGKEPMCARNFKPYSQCKALIGTKPPNGNETFPLVAASKIEPGGGTPTKLTKAMLLHIMSPSMTGTASQIAKKKQNLNNALPQLRRTFELFGLDTVRSQAHFLAHYGGELGGDPGNFGIVEKFTTLACKEPNKKRFLGRGPLQVTCRVTYAMALAYLEHRHDQLIVERVNDAIASNPDQVWSAFMNAISDFGIKSLASAHKAIKANPNAAAQFSKGFVLSGAYWHAAGCGKDMPGLAAIGDAKPSDFIGSGKGSKCVSGGGVSHSGNDRAKIKACIYNVAMKSLPSGAPKQHACMGGTSQSGGAKSKPKIKIHKGRKLRGRPFKLRRLKK